MRKCYNIAVFSKKQNEKEISKRRKGIDESKEKKGGSNETFF